MKTFYLVGGGRHVRTRSTRRINRFAGKVFHLGPFIIRPNRRVPVTIDFVAKHYAAICSAISAGNLIVQHDADNYVDLAELQEIMAGYGADGQPAMEPAPAVQEEAVAPAEEQPADPPPPEPPAPAAPEPQEEAPAEQPAEPAPEPDADEPASEPASDEPFSLPAGWRSAPKRELLQFAAQLGLEADGSMSNRVLVELIDAAGAPGDNE